MSLQYIRLEGNLFTSDHLARVHAGDKDLGGLTAKDYEVRRRLDDEISEAYNKVEAAWGYFKLRKRIESNDPFDVTHDWISDVWKALGGGPLPQRAAPQIEGKSYPIRYEWEGVPIHIVAHDQDLEKGPKGDARGNPHSTLQEYVNRREETLWGILTNGLTLRILRDNANSTRPAYVEFDLKGMMEAQSFAEFGIFWRMCHHTRFFNGADSWLEKWMHESASRGTPARDLLRGAVKNALLTLGRGFLRHPKNKLLRQRFQRGELSPEDYYRQLLRLVYRLIFLFVTEDRGLLLQPDASREAKERFAEYYSTQRLRKLSHTFRGTRHHDLYESVKVVMDGLKDPKGKPALALPPLNSDLWSRDFVPDLDPPATTAERETGYLENRDLLSAVHDLSRIRLEGGDYRTVDYRNLGSEELGSIYESLLELEARVDVEGRSFRLVDEGGGDRRTTGSHYTPQNLIDEVLDHALEPLLDEAEKAEKPDEAILALTVCDPTCGSGHFLIAAAHRMAKRLAKWRTGDPEPAPGDLRSAIREVIGRCIYGVDINPMSVELCKVSLWLEAMEPGKPLAYLDHHIKCGNALLGVSPDLLERGIPEEAYTSRPKLDDRATCRKLVKRNKDFPMNARTLDGFRLDQRRVSEILSAALDRIEWMPTTTVVEVEAKASEYKRSFVETDEYDRYKHAMDAWCAAFSYQKRVGRDRTHLTNVELVDFLHPDAQMSRETLELINGEQRKEKNRFFHWSLEFPAVFRSDGFDAVIGNPPYLGGQKISGELGHHYNHFLSALHADYQVKGDLAGAFLLRFSTLVKSLGFVGIITTNSVGKGFTRENGLARLLQEGFLVRMAHPDQIWEGDANVVVTVLVLSHRRGPRWLRGQEVDSISSRLDSLSEQNIVSLPARSGKAFMGHQPVGDGFLITAEQAERLLKSDPRNRDVLFPYPTAHDLLQRSDRSPSRWIICFHDWDRSRAEAYTTVFDHVEATVKPYRDGKAGYGTWWTFGRYRGELRQAVGDLEHVIVRPAVTETPLFLRVRADYLFGNSLFVFALNDWESLGVLNSGIHEVWYRKEGSALHQRTRYTPNTCFDPFPHPNSSSEVGRIGEELQNMLFEVADARGVALTPLWHMFNDPKCPDDDILTLRALRNELTQAVAAAFSIRGVDYRFDHYADHADRWRYTMHPEAAEQVYLRLVELNGEEAGVQKVTPARRAARGQATIAGPRQVRLGD